MSSLYLPPSLPYDPSEAGPSRQQYSKYSTTDSAANASSNGSPGSRLRSLKNRPWPFGSHRSKASDGSPVNTSSSGPNRNQKTAAGHLGDEEEGGIDHLVQPYSALRVDERTPSERRRYEHDYGLKDPTVPERTAEGSVRSTRTGGGWASDEEEEVDIEPDAYSWVDPSMLGTERLEVSSPRPPSRSQPSSPGASSSLIQDAWNADIPLARAPPVPSKPQRPGQLDPRDSYNLLLAYQSSTSSQNHSSSSHSTRQTPPETPSHSTEATHQRLADPEWHELVDGNMIESLGRQEVQRQGLWWELVKGEVEFVRDLRVVTQGFIAPLQSHHPPVLTPEARLHAFVAEVFSTLPAIGAAHEALLERLLERQRAEWPLLTSAADLILVTFLDIVDLYETYMKNYPFADARVRRESERNPDFKSFLQDRNTLELTRRRDISVFLSRPVTRLPRILLLLEALLRCTPEDHPDREAIPTVISILTSALKGSQPGIESAEAKIKLWNVAEQLLFKKGEIIELDIGEPKRTLVHAGYVFRRVRSETNWHGWQDLHAFLIDNYFLLTRDEEHGKHVVVSRPIHIDFLNLVSANGVPERRHDYIAQVWLTEWEYRTDPVFKPERLMYPFTITTESGENGRTYTLCTASQNARDQWREKIESAKTLRKFDSESNRHFAVHSLYVPSEVKEPIMAADTFTWLGRETVAIATPRSVWIGWRRDSKSYRELIHFGSGFISSITIMPDFGRLLVLSSGSLWAFDLTQMIPTHEPVTWTRVAGRSGVELSGPEHTVAFVRMGMTKGRLLIVHASYAKNSHVTNLHFDEPLHSSTTGPDPQRSTRSFRRFATLQIPGYASELSFFRQTIAVVTEKSFVIAEPGNPTYNQIPTFPSSIPQSSMVGRMVSNAKPMAMYQIGENDFLLCYNWGACFVTKYGEITRNGSFMRWNVTPSYIAYRPPYLLLFDEAGGKIEVRDVASGRMCEVIEERGLKALRLSRIEQGMLAISPRGLLDVVETVEL